MSKNGNTEKLVFLACPIGDDNTPTRKNSDTVFKYFLADIIKNNTEFKNVKLVRADQIAKSGRITTQIIRELISADVCIADLTELNPNVLYELGIRQALLRPYILIATTGTRLPFDLKDSRTIFYDTHDIEAMALARDNLAKYLSEALKGTIDSYDQELFGSKELTKTKPQEPIEIRMMETLGSVIEAERATAKAVDELSQRLSLTANQIESTVTASYRGAGNYLFINGEDQAFSALVAALYRAKKCIRTTRYSPFAVGARQKKFAETIDSRVLGDRKYSPVRYFYRIIAANNTSKLDDIKGYLDKFIGKKFTLFLIPYSNNFEIVIIDDTEVFIHFHGRDKIIDSTLHIINQEVASKFTEIYSSLHDPSLHPDIKKYDFEYISMSDKDRIFEEIENYFSNHCIQKPDQDQQI